MPLKNFKLDPSRDLLYPDFECYQMDLSGPVNATIAAGEGGEDFKLGPSWAKVAANPVKAKGFISPERVAQSVLYRRSGKLGNARVLHELRSKGLDDATVRAAAEQLKDTEHARAWDVWQRKFGTVAATPQERLKQMRFLASRGFGGDVVNKVLRGQSPDGEEG